MTKEDQAFLKINGFFTRETDEFNHRHFLINGGRTVLNFQHRLESDTWFITFDDKFTNEFITVEYSYQGELSHFQELVSCFNRYFK